MKLPAIRKSRSTSPSRCRQRGVTMVLVALAMVAIIAMAVMSIDLITLYLAREEAQRSADQAALAAARVISLSGITGDPGNSALSWQAICGGSTSPATLAAIAVATQSSVGNAVPSSPSVIYSAGGATNADCSALPAAFGVNPIVTVQVTRSSLPTFFSRIWGNPGNSISATAAAEVFNPSNSGNVGNSPTGVITPVQPRCVKPWIVPNLDPQNPNTTCTNDTSCKKLVDLGSGQIITGGISLGGGNPSTGVIGETFWLSPDCVHNSSPCSLRRNPPAANYYPNGSGLYELPPSLQYLPGQTLYSSTAVPSSAAPGCSGGSRSNYEEAIEGCDQTTIYQCGVQNMNTVDLSENPGEATNDTLNGVQCLTHQSDASNITSSSGQDYLAGNNNFAAPSSYPFQILAGASNPLLGPGLAASTPITSSSSIVSVPIYDQTANGGSINNNGTTPVTIVGFLQVFINAADVAGNVNVTVLNLAGCGNGNSPPNPAITGSSPVPIRLITPP